jgi:uncharacterized repeat protein (TIGR02543 family)
VATLTTPQFGSNTCPQAQLVVTESSSTATTSTLSWTLKWVTHGYTVNSSVAKEYTVKINGSVVKTGTFSIGGKSSQNIASGTVTITKGTSSQSIPLWFSFVMNFTWKGTYGGTKTASGSISVGAKTSYKVSYNANGGSGAPSQQTKWYGTNLTLSTTKPSRTGYTFKGWATSASGAVAYASGATYSANASVTLYAVWEAITYKVTYNANGGSGAPAQQTKTYGKALTLSTTKPTRTNYNFKGWATSASGSVAYAAGASYTANAAITLYAVWELAYTPPTITNVEVQRCDSSGTAVETGTYCKVSFSWSCNQLAGSNPVKTITIAWGSETKTVTASGNSGSVSQVIGGSLGVDSTYIFTIKVTDNKNGATTVKKTLGTTKFPIDFKAGGTGVAFGKTAETNNLAEFGYQAKFTGGILQPILAVGTDMNTILTPNVYSGRNITDNAYSNVPFTAGTFTLRVEAAGPSGQIKQTITSCDKNKARVWERFYYVSAWGDWKCVYDMPGTVLWEGSYYMTDTQTATLNENVSEQPSGIVLVFSEYYDGEAKNQTFVSFFVHKRLVALQPGKGHCIIMSTHTFSWAATKYLYISDNKIVGHANNKATGTGTSGITYTNNRFVLRYVIGV